MRTSSVLFISFVVLARFVFAAAPEVRGPNRSNNNLVGSQESVENQTLGSFGGEGSSPFSTGGESPSSGSSGSKKKPFMSVYVVDRIRRTPSWAMNNSAIAQLLSSGDCRDEASMAVTGSRGSIRPTTSGAMNNSATARSLSSGNNLRRKAGECECQDSPSVASRLCMRINHLYNLGSPSERRVTSCARPRIRIVALSRHDRHFTFFQGLQAVAKINVELLPEVSTFRAVYNIMVAQPMSDLKIEIDPDQPKMNLDGNPLSGPQNQQDLDKMMKDITYNNEPATLYGDFIARWWLLRQEYCDRGNETFYEQLRKRDIENTWKYFGIDPKKDKTTKLVQFLAKLGSIGIWAIKTGTPDVTLYQLIRIIRSVILRMPDPLEVVYWLQLILLTSVTWHKGNVIRLQTVLSEKHLAKLLEGMDDTASP